MEGKDWGMEDDGVRGKVERGDGKDGRRRKGGVGCFCVGGNAGAAMAFLSSYARTCSQIRLCRMGKHNYYAGFASSKLGILCILRKFAQNCVARRFPDRI